MNAPAPPRSRSRWLGLCAGLLLPALGAAAGPGSLDRPRLPESQGSGGKAQCAADADCVMVPADCCGCSAGGKQRALPRSEEARDRREREQRCRDTLCPQVLSNDPSCRATARCVAGRCEAR